MQFSNTELIEGTRAGDPRCISRVLTLVENRSPRAQEIQRQLFRATGKAHVIGITGSPGAGKSTLVNELAMYWRAQGKRVAILAVDPTSPFSGGAVLGDRVRMEAALEGGDIFARSMASRGALGGVAHATADAIDVLDAAGFEVIMVETVGVGQGEIDIARIAQTAIVVLVPGMGDEVQVMKAGILEIADLFVINKSERPGTHELERELRILLTLVHQPQEAWRPDVIRTVAIEKKGIAEVVAASEKHRTWLAGGEEGARRRQARLQERIVRILNEQFERGIYEKYIDRLKISAAACVAQTTDPYSAAALLAKDLLK